MTLKINGNMGAFIIFDIEFETIKDRIKFEKRYNIKKEDILVGEDSKCYGFAWTYIRDVNLNVVYNMGFMGYGDPSIILKECLTGSKLVTDLKTFNQHWNKPNKNKVIKIKFLSWIPINDKNSMWEKIRGRW